ncbi:uncharacterized protein DSM5745_03990 [Aspergillus mulundensis]|uniref:non-specific serine/threonine protein kinase n=1 Tax=Aspergillus mulundensis TaxID=1810919 RepID=A0A3D8SC51_9EURO|nr:Uncharacterized protein DSM5745_03990 [Aspergillus mulundensis]RDW83664.1 Uncharacterized protein DSM5745_03990 [Aspergillus mulundensis]
MASNEYDSLHKEVYDEVYSYLERKDRESLRFAPVGTAELVFHTDKLRRFFRSLLEPGRTILDQFKATEDELVEITKERRLHRFLIVLVIAGCSVRSARIATGVLLADDESAVGRNGTRIPSLPANREDLKVLFGGDEVDADKFLGKQAYFCPIIINRRTEMRFDATDHLRLPYLEEQPMGKGFFGQVFKVKIAKGHLYDPIHGSANLDPTEVARKDYQVSNEFDPAAEREIMEMIHASSAWECPNILRNMGSLAFGPRSYSLFMPLAICDLRAYMMDHHQSRPNSIAEKMDIIRCAVGLAGGLHFLHHEMKTPKMEQLVCYHMDLKPSNILIFSEPGRDGRIRNIWRISDFGMSCMKIRRSKGGFEAERNVNRWFIRRPEPDTKDPSLSGTLNRRAEGTYLAPEADSPDRVMKSNSDVWSLGCVLSVLFAYMEDGREGVIQYADERLRCNEAGASDKFAVRGFRGTKPNPAIGKIHGYLTKRANGRSGREGAIVDDSLSYIEKHVVQIDQSKRKGAKDVADMLETTFKGYNKLAEDRHSSLLKEFTESRGYRVRQQILAKLPRKDPDAPFTTVDQWYLSEAEAFKGCQISPDCSFVAYWTDRKILLYQTHSLGFVKGDSVSCVGQFTLRRDNCFWDSVRLTDKYLVASTTEATFHCVVFDLQKQRSLDSHYPVELPQPAIRKIAISPNSSTLACVVKASDDERKPGSLLLFRLTRTDPTSSAERWWKRTLRWPAGHIARLFFSTAEDVYLVVRPQLTIPSTDHKVYVVHVNIITKDMHCLPIEPRGLDSSSTARLFTTLAPFHNRPTMCAVVTREKQLHIQDLAAENTMTPIRKDIKNYRVLKLMMSSQDDKLYAVARHPVNYKILLVELTVPRSNEDEVRFRELTTLPNLAEDDQFTERLHDTTDGKGILLASLVGAGRRAIHRILFNEATN